MKCPFLTANRYCAHNSYIRSKKIRCKHQTRCPLIEESKSLVADAYKKEKDALAELKIGIEDIPDIT